MRIDVIPGARIGMLTVLSEAAPKLDARGHTVRQFLCQCDCGKEAVLNYNNIRGGLVKSCGCTRFPKTSPIDLSGQRFGKLTVIAEATRYVQKSGKKLRRWKCRCDCGNESIVLQTNLTAEHGTKSCGCNNSPGRRPISNRTLIGNRYGKLVVVDLADPHIKPDGYHRKRWTCRCDCGNTVTVEADNLLNGHTRSCGCLKRTGLSLSSDAFRKYRHILGSFKPIKAGYFAVGFVKIFNLYKRMSTAQ